MGELLLLEDTAHTPAGLLVVAGWWLLLFIVVSPLIWSPLADCQTAKSIESGVNATSSLAE